MILSINSRVEDGADTGRSEFVEVHVAGGFDPQTIRMEAKEYKACFEPSTTGFMEGTKVMSAATVSEETPVHTTVGTDNHPGIPQAQSFIRVLESKGLNLAQLIREEPEEIQIESNLAECLALPWEDLVPAIHDRHLYISRRVRRSDELTPTANRKILIATSDAYRDELKGKSMGDISSDFPDEVSAITKALYASHESEPLEVTLYRHLGRSNFEDFDKSEYGIIHIMMHGEKSRLGFEKAEDSRFIDWIDTQEFIGFCASTSAKLVFLSACDSAYGEKELSSLAHLLIEKGVTEYAIGFNWRMESTKTLPKFANVFYENYYRSGNIETGFRRAVEALIQDRSPYWSRPTLYLGAEL